MSRQIQRLYNMIGTFVSHYKKRPGAVVAGGEELRILCQEVGGHPWMVCELPVYLVDDNILGVIEDPGELQRRGVGRSAIERGEVKGERGV